MVTTSKTWSFSLNNNLSSSIDMEDQYREAFFALKSWFVSASWTVTMSAGLVGGVSGTFTASTGDNIVTKNDIVWGTLATQTGSYFVLTPPANWLPSGSSREPFELLFAATAANGSIVPRTITVISLSGNFKLNGTNPNARTPVAASGVLITCSNAQNFLAGATATAQKWHGWKTSDGDVLFGLSDGIEMDYAIWITSFNKRSSPGEGIYRFALYTPPGGSALDGSNLKTTSYWSGYTNDGRSAATGYPNCVAWSAVGWTGGRTGNSNSVIKAPADFVDNGANGRYIGRFLDISGSGTAVSSNNLVDGDDDPIRSVTVGSLWLPAPTGSLPIQF